ncbi:MAG TPA: HAD family hydrolase [Patescibacteria group bacterium]|jgi:HAD superfamily hydrolase (TIGR01549 family)
MQNPSETLSAAVFDSDGTVVDTRELIIEGYLRSLYQDDPEHRFDRTAIEMAIGQPVPETYARLLGLPKDDPRVIELSRQHDTVQDGLVHLVEEYVGMIELLEKLRANRKKVGMFTSGTIPHIERNFRAVGYSVHDLFDATVTVEDGPTAKPDGEGIVICCQQLDVPVDETAFVGDSRYDILASKDAGVGITVGVTHGFGTEQELYEAGADYVVGDPAALEAILLDS